MSSSRPSATSPSSTRQPTSPTSIPSSSIVVRVTTICAHAAASRSTVFALSAPWARRTNARFFAVKWSRCPQWIFVPRDWRCVPRESREQSRNPWLRVDGMGSGTRRLPRKRTTRCWRKPPRRRMHRPGDSLGQTSRRRFLRGPRRQMFQLRLPESAGPARSQQARGPLRDDDLIVRRDVVAVRVRDESKRLRVRRIEPDAFVRQINAPLVSDRNHGGKLAASHGARELRRRVSRRD